MSLSALLTATRNHLRTQLVGAPVLLLDSECDVWPDGRPPPSFGERYLSVHPTQWTKGSTNDPVRALDESYALSVTITQRTGVIPRDRVTSNLFLTALTGMEALARKVMVTVHDNWTLFAAVNALIPGSDELLETLYWQGNDPFPQPQDASWCWSTNPDEYVARQGNYAVAAFTLEVRFGTARRIQSYSDME